MTTSIVCDHMDQILLLLLLLLLFPVFDAFRNILRGPYPQVWTKLPPNEMQMLRWRKAQTPAFFPLVDFKTEGGVKM